MPNEIQPTATLDTMPPTARAWVFGAASSLSVDATPSLLRTVDAYLESWKAHGAPLVCGREWQHGCFLVVAVDEAATGASGCSIDGLFRVLTSLELSVGVSLVESGRVFWRDRTGSVVSAPRTEFVASARAGHITDDTTVFDTTITTVGAWRTQFEQPLSQSWQARLIRR